jgi:hypothetical protein
MQRKRPIPRHAIEAGVARALIPQSFVGGTELVPYLAWRGSMGHGGDVVVRVFEHRQS